MQSLSLVELGFCCGFIGSYWWSFSAFSLRSDDLSSEGFDDTPRGDGSRWWTTVTSRGVYHYFLDIAGVMAAPYLRETYQALQVEMLVLYFTHLLVYVMHAIA